MSFTELPPATIAAVVLIPLAGKFVGAFVGTFGARVESPLAIVMGLMAKGVAEIAFLLVLFEDGIIERDVFSLLVLTMFLYILLMPVLIELAVKRTKESDHPDVPTTVPPSFARYALQGIKASSVMDTAESYPTSDTTLREYSDQWAASDRSDHLVLENGGVAGIVSIVDLHRVARSQWSATPLRTVLRHEVPQAWPDEPLAEVLERMAEHSLNVIPVVARYTDEFLGAITTREVVDLLLLMDEIQEELDVRGENQE